MRAIVLFISISLNIQVLAQHLPVPVFTHISVENYPQQKVVLEWECANLQDIDGFIIYRTAYDLPAIADSAFVTLIEIQDNQMLSYTDVSFINNNPDIALHHYAYEIASFKKIDNDYEYSELSEAIAPIYLKNINLQKCNSEILLEWQSAYGMELNNQQIKVITANGEFSVSSNGQNSAIIPIEDENFGLSPSTDSINACFSIYGTNSGKISRSNTLCLSESRNQNLAIAIDSLIINEPAIELFYSSQESNALYYWVIQTYQLNQLLQVDTFAANQRSFTLEKSTFENLHFTVLAYNQCDILIGHSQNISPLILSAYENEPSVSAYRIKSNQPLAETETIIKASLWVGEPDAGFSILEESAYLPEYWLDDNLENSPSKNYKLRLFTQNAYNGGFATTYQSNTLKLFKESQMLIPNAIHLLSPNENDRFFSVKASFCSDFSIEIYDNKGIKLFSADDISFRWLPSNSKQTTAYSVYFYVIKYKNSKGIDYVVKDKFIVLR